MNELFGTLGNFIGNEFIFMIGVMIVIMIFRNKIIGVAEQETGAVTISLQKIIFNNSGVMISILILYIYYNEALNIAPALIKMGVPNPRGTLICLLGLAAILNISGSFRISTAIADRKITQSEGWTIVLLILGVIATQTLIIYHFVYNGFIKVFHLERQLGIINDIEYQQRLLHGYFQLWTNITLAAVELFLTVVGGTVDLFRTDKIHATITSTLPGAGTVPSPSPTTPAFAGTGTFSTIPKGI